MRKPMRAKWSEGVTGWLFLSPAVGIIFLCVAVPALVAFALSFTQCSRFLSAHWAGLDNYQRMFTDVVTAKAFGNTLFYLAAFVPLNLALSLGVALLLNREFRGMRFIRSVYFVPVAVSGVVAISIFRFLFNRDNGPVNAVLGTLGFEPISWLWDSRWAMWAVVLITLWKSTAFFSIILLAALQDVQKELYEAAAVDGAGWAGRFLHVTLPSIMPVVMVVITLSSIGAFRVFEPMFVLTRGGPSYSTHTVALEAYNSAFASGEIGYSSAVSFALLAIVLVATLALNRVARRFE